MIYMENWEKTKQRFEAFWKGEIIDRCMIAVFSPKKNTHYGNFEFCEDMKSRQKYWTDGETVLRRNLDYFENTYFGGDAIPQIFLNLGAAGHAGYFKGSRHAYERETIWFQPSIQDIEKDELEFDKNSFLYKKTIELATYLSDESKGRYMVSMPDVSGNADALAHLRGSENLLMDMLTEKDWVHESLEKIQKAWLGIYDEIYSILNSKNDGGTTIGWLNTWSPGKHGQMQSDISVMLSPETFDEFILPELYAQTQWYERSLYHFDGIEQIRHLDKLLAIEKLHAIQWTHVAGQPSPVQYVPYLRKIQEAGKRLVIICDNMTILEGLLENLSSKGLLLITKTSTEEEARDVVKKVEKLTHE